MFMIYYMFIIEVILCVKLYGHTHWKVHHWPLEADNICKLNMLSVQKRLNAKLSWNFTLNVVKICSQFGVKQLFVNCLFIVFTGKVLRVWSSVSNQHYPGAGVQHMRQTDCQGCGEVAVQHTWKSLKTHVLWSNLLCVFTHRCAGWVQWHYLRIWTNLLREDSHHGGTVFRAIHLYSTNQIRKSGFCRTHLAITISHLTTSYCRASCTTLTRWGSFLVSLRTFSTISLLWMKTWNSTSRYVMS